MALAQRLAADVQGPLVAGAGRRRTCPARSGCTPGCCSWWRCRGGPRPAPCGRCPGPSGSRGWASPYWPCASRLPRQVVVAGGGVGVVLAQRLAADVQGLLEQGLGLGVPALRVQVVRQVVVAGGGVGVVLAQRLARCPGPSGEGLGLAYGLAARLAPGCCSLAVWGGPRPAPSRMSRACWNSGWASAYLPCVQVGRQVVVAGGGVGVVLAQRLAADVQGLLVAGAGRRRTCPAASRLAARLL